MRKLAWRRDTSLLIAPAVVLCSAIALNGKAPDVVQLVDKMMQLVQNFRIAAIGDDALQDEGQSHDKPLVTLRTDAVNLLFHAVAN